MRDPLEKRYERRRKWVLVPAALAVFSSLHLCSAIGWGATAAQTFDPRDPDSIGKFLESLAPRSEAEVTKLIEEMSSDQFIARQNAVRELAKVAVSMRSFLEAVLRDTRDPEIRRGLAQVLGKAKAVRPGEALASAAAAVARYGHRGLAAELVRTVGAAPDHSAAETIIAAACTSFEAAEVPALKAALKLATPEVRTAAARVLVAQGGDLRELMLPLLRDRSPAAQLVAAEAFARASDPACIPVLANLATSNDFYLRWRAIGFLRQIVPAAADLDALDTPAKPLADLAAMPGWKASAAPAAIPLLTDGHELKTWKKARHHHLDEFRPTQLDGFVRFAATSQCVWSHPLRFQNYRLRLEWRFPGDGLSDSGIALVKFPGEVPQEFMKWVEKDSLEVQLFRGRSGNLFAHGSKIQVGGEWLDGISSEKFYPDNELPGWNQLEIDSKTSDRSFNNQPLR